jgi:formyltetrahydrofolate deformylase
MIGNRPACRSLAEQFGIDWHMVGDDNGKADEERLIALCDEYQVDYIVLARYMQVLLPSTCWKYAGGRIINLHHGLLPSFPGMRPYDAAYASRMLTYGATCHFIVPELDEGNRWGRRTTSRAAWWKESAAWWSGKCSCTFTGSSSVISHWSFVSGE